MSDGFGTPSGGNGELPLGPVGPGQGEAAEAGEWWNFQGEGALARMSPGDRDVVLGSPEFMNVFEPTLHARLLDEEGYDDRFQLTLDETHHLVERSGDVLDMTPSDWVQAGNSLLEWPDVETVLEDAYGLLLELTEQAEGGLSAQELDQQTAVPIQDRRLGAVFASDAKRGLREGQVRRVAWIAAGAAALAAALAALSQCEPAEPAPLDIPSSTTTAPATSQPGL